MHTMHVDHVHTMLANTFTVLKLLVPLGRCRDCAVVPVNVKTRTVKIWQKHDLDMDILRLNDSDKQHFEETTQEKSKLRLETDSDKTICVLKTAPGEGQFASKKWIRTNNNLPLKN
jgi:hypothetical protein